MEKKELEWTVVGLVGLLLLIIGYYVEPLGFLMWIGGPLIFISLYFIYKCRNMIT